MQTHVKMLLGVAAIGLLVFVVAMTSQSYGIATIAIVAAFVAALFYSLGKANLPRQTSRTDDS